MRFSRTRMPWLARRDQEGTADTADRHFAAACPFPLRESTADVGDEAQRSHAEGRGGVYREAASRREGTRIPDLVKGTGVGG